jgi:hypothetical protein
MKAGRQAVRQSGSQAVRQSGSQAVRQSGSKIDATSVGREEISGNTTPYQALDLELSR